MTPPTRLSTLGTKGMIKALIADRPVEVARAMPPWSGLLQDSTTGLYSAGNTFGNSELYGPATVFTSNFVCCNEVLTWDYGWKRMQGATAAKAPPLGGHTTPFPLGSTTASCNAVGALVYLPSIANVTAAGASVESNIAITNYLAANGNGIPFYLNIAAGDWAAATASGGAAGVTTDASRRIDYTIYSLANNPIVAARQATLIFCNGVGTGGKVWYYPSDRDGTTYSYFPLTTAAPYPNLTNFMAESVCTADERVIFLGTSENGISYPQRVRWTAQSWTRLDALSEYAIWNNLIDGGAGGLDLVEFGGKGLRIMPQGDRIVTYFSDGIAVLEPTGQTVPAFTRSYITKNRGLLGKGSVIDLGGGVHFGIFTDGFWFFTEGGEWKEAGILDVEGTRVHKWTDYFFSILDRTKADRITMGYDPERRFVLISFPGIGDGGAPRQTWVYEVGPDRIWSQNYAMGGGSQLGYAWGWLRSTEGPTSVKMALAHGSVNGFVWEHVPNLYQRDGNNVSWSITTAVSDYGDPYSFKTLIADRYSYHNHGVVGTFVTYDIYQGQTATVAFTYPGTVAIPATTSERGVLMVPVHATGLSLRHVVTGNHPFTLFGMQHEFVRSGDAL